MKIYPEFCSLRLPPPSSHSSSLLTHGSELAVHLELMNMDNRQFVGIFQKSITANEPSGSMQRRGPRSEDFLLQLPQMDSVWDFQKRNKSEPNLPKIHSIWV